MRDGLGVFMEAFLYVEGSDLRAPVLHVVCQDAFSGL